MYSLGEVDFIQGMLDLGPPKNSVGLKPKAKLRKGAKAPSYNIGKKRACFWHPVERCVIR
jgi:hypothetical protein